MTGERKKDKEAKVGTAKDLWVPAVNNHASASLSTGSGFGRWAFLEIQDPWNAQSLIRVFLASLRPAMLVR